MATTPLNEELAVLESIEILDRYRHRWHGQGRIDPRCPLCPTVPVSYTKTSRTDEVTATLVPG